MGPLVVRTAPRTVYRSEKCPRCGGLLLPYRLEGEEGRVPESVYRCWSCSRLYIETFENHKRVWMSWVRHAVSR